MITILTNEEKKTISTITYTKKDIDNMNGDDLMIFITNIEDGVYENDGEYNYKFENSVGELYHYAVEVYFNKYE